jgi:hypothetical protein
LKKLLLGLGSLLGGVLGGFVESSSLLNGGVRVELEHALDVLEWVLLDSRSLGGGSSGLESSLKRIIKNCFYCEKVNLDFISLEDSLEISVGEDWSWHGEAFLVGRRVDGIKSLESFGGVDGESSNVATWGELEEVKLVDWDKGNAWDVSHGLDDTVVVLVNHEGTSLLDSSSVSHLSSTGSESSSFLDSVDVVEGADLSEDGDGGLGLLESLGGGVDYEWELRDVVDNVTLGHGEGWDTGGGDGRDGGISSLGDVDTSVPVAPGLVGVEHSTASAHVTESSGTRSRGTTTSDTGNTSDSSASSPRLGGSLFTGFVGDGVWLSGVLGDVGMDELDDISSDGSLGSDFTT